MKIAFDMDGTITAYPTQCEKLASALIAAGHRVVVLTGHAVANPNKDEREKATSGKNSCLAAIGFTSFHEMICCIVRNSMEAAAFKAGYCRGEGIDILIDDAKGYCEAVKVESPGTLVLHVHEVESRK